MVVAPEYQGTQTFMGDYVYWVGRDGCGNTRGFRQLLNGNKRDVSQPVEHLRREELPSDSLQREFDVLQRGGVPSEVFRQSSTISVEVVRLTR